MVFPNLYYKRTAATAKACFVCYKPTATVLATIDTADFFYTCPIHLTDRGFATRAPEPEPEPEPGPKKPSVSPEEIAKVKQEWEEKQRHKVQEKEGSQVDGDGKDGEGVRKDAEGKEADVAMKADQREEKKPATAVQAVVTPSTPPSESTSRPTHERYVLHRTIFALRTADHRRRRQAVQTKNLAPRLPGAPTSSLP